jgi:hypothetical protein
MNKETFMFSNALVLLTAARDGHSGVRIPPDAAGNGIFPESFRPVPRILLREPKGNRRKVEAVFRTGFPRT